MHNVTQKFPIEYFFEFYENYCRPVFTPPIAAVMSEYYSLKDSCAGFYRSLRNLSVADVFALFQEYLHYVRLFYHFRSMMLKSRTFFEFHVLQPIFYSWRLFTDWIERFFSVNTNSELASVLSTATSWSVYDSTLSFDDVVLHWW